MHPLHDLIDEATQNVRPASHGQRESDHVWEYGEGARACPRGGDGSQSVYECKVCPAVDYGQPPGPGFQECFSSMHGCDGCFSASALMDIQDALDGKPWDPLEQYQLHCRSRHDG
jgi:hypothetical protein